MTKQSSETSFTTGDHSTVINHIGVVFTGFPHGWGARFEPKDALAHAEYLLAHKEHLLQLQQQLEQMWHEVLLEVKQRFEQGPDGRPFREATEHDLQEILEQVAGQDASGYFLKAPTSPAGRWYRAMWDAEGRDTTTYEQQWTPFLHRFHAFQASLRTAS